MIWHALVDSGLSLRLCLTLFHSLWQVALLALVSWCVDLLWCSSSVERRYAVNVVALLAALLALPLTYVLIDVSERPNNLPIETAALTRVAESRQPSVTASPSEDTVVTPTETQTPLSLPGKLDVEPPATPSASFVVTRALGTPSPRWLLLAPWIVVFYACGVILMLVRLAVAIFNTNRLVANADLITHGPLVESLKTLADNWSMRVVPALARVEQVVVPAVIGLTRPMILLPASAVSGLSLNELQMILAHEVAHVRRYDMWVNLAQRVAEAVLFFNPGLWFLSRRVSTLREYCCDEMTCRSQSASTLGPRLRYATALLRVVELAQPNTPTSSDLASLAASGRSPSEMRRRVARLFGEPVREPLPVSGGGALTMFLLIAALTMGLPVWNTQADPPVDRADSDSIADRNDDDTPYEFRLNVVGPNRSPVPNASVEIRVAPAPKAEQVSRGKFVRGSKYGTFAETDHSGRLTLALPRRPERFNISIKRPGYGPYWAGWDSSGHPQAIPQRFTAELDEGWSVGGVVVDGSGQPVVGVKVQPSVNYKKRPGDTDQLGVGTRIVTDSEGKWRFDHVPVSMTDVHLSFSHPEYAPLRQRLPRNGFEVELDQAPSGRIELNQGLVVTGTVTDESGQPIRGALVRGKFLNDIREASTDQYGVYRIVGCEPRMTRVVVSAKGRATDMQEVRVDPDMATVDFSMKPGGRIRIRVVDEQGKGIPKARIFFQRWRGRFEYFEFDHVSQYADKNGVWEWTEAPLDEFQADICRPDGMQLSRQPLIASEQEFVFKPPRALVVSGSVVDAKTKEPIRRFRVIPGLRNIDPRIRTNWIPGDSYEASDGKYRIRMTHAYPAHLVRVEADGYEVAISRDIMTDEGEVDFDFELQPAEDIAAEILSAAGRPAAHAKIALGVAGSQISVNQGEIDDGSTYATRLDADADGIFSIPARDEPFQLVITHSSGFAHLKSADGPIPDRIKLTPWARVEGTFRVGEDPAPNVVLSMFAEGIHSYGDDVPNIFTHHDVTTGKDGRFVFERVFPGQGRIGRRILLMVDEGATEVTSSQRVSAEFISGETTTLDLGGSGRPVVGKLAPPADYFERVLWNFALVNVRANLKAPRAPAGPASVRDNPELRKAWQEAWKATDEGKAWTVAYEAYQQLRSKFPYITASVDRDGSFRIDDMPPGAYVLSVRFSQNAPGVLADYRFVVPPVEEGRAAERFELGTLKLDEP